jgi:hypothetical protein
MGIGVSIFLLAIGAILAFAVDVTTRGLDLNAVGVILMIVGALGLLTSFLFWDRLGFGGYRRTVVHDYDAEPVVTRGVVRERRVVRDREVL